jgi:hypothetical protein
MIAVVTEEKILRNPEHKRLQEKSQWCFWYGFVLSYIGFVLSSLTYLQDDLQSLTIPGAAQVAVAMSVAGFFLLAGAVLLDLRSYQLEG